MGAAVMPFPLAKRRGFIARQAGRMADLSHESAERHLRRQLEVQAEAQRRRGIPEHLIAKELAAAESAIRVELWRVVMLGRTDDGTA